MGSHTERAEKRLSLGSREVVRRIPNLLLPMLALLVAGMIVVFSRDRIRDRDLVRQRGADMVQVQSAMIEEELRRVSANLLLFADQKILRDFLADRSTRGTIEKEYTHFCLVSGIFDQIRVIDEDGRETLRVNYDDGDPAPVPVEGLQSKGDRYYVKVALALQRSQIYISPFDLNQEHGRIEEPWKPVLRLVTPVFDDAGKKRGILVLNYLGQKLLDRLAEIAAQAPGWTGIVNEGGYYLEGPERGRSWGFMFGQDPTFTADHADAWAAIRDRQEGSFSTDEGMFTFQAVVPRGQLQLSADFPTRLEVVSFVPTDVVYAASWHTFERLAIVAGIVALVLLGIAWRLAFVGAVREHHEKKIAASEQRLRTLSRKLLDAQESERRSLARDLHDEVGQLATAITIDLKRARKAGDASAKDELIDRSLEETAHLLNSMHRISSRIRTSILDDLGLKAALRSCGEDFQRNSGVSVRIELDFEDEALADSVAENVYRIVQEALTNVSRHAMAGDVDVRVWQHDGQVSLSVADAGVGFDPATADPERLGLLGMRERAELLGGTFSVESAPAQGTVVSATIPLWSAGEHFEEGTS